MSIFGWLTHPYTDTHRLIQRHTETHTDTKTHIKRDTHTHGRMSIFVRLDQLNWSRAASSDSHWAVSPWCVLLFVCDWLCVGVCGCVCLCLYEFVCGCDCLCVAVCVCRADTLQLYGLLKIIKLVYSDYVKNGSSKLPNLKFAQKIINGLWALVCYIMDSSHLLHNCITAFILKILHKIYNS